ncbi:MAG: hypothetical protein IJB57_04620 [Clostridia bacterium]|nr:hypothetical protein [Clostridia bacterium]
MFNNVDSTSRNNVDIWTGGIISATGQACMAVMATGVFAALLFSERKPLIKVLALIGMITVFAYNLVLAGRTLIILMILLLAVAYVYSAKKAQIQRLGKVLIIPIIIGIIIYFIYSLNVFGVRDWIMDSNFYYRFNRMSFVDDARMNTRVIYISQMLRYPFGGGQMRREIGGYAHELYLDAYNDVGMIGYLLLIGFVVSSAVRVLKLVFKTNYDNDFKLLVLCVYIATIVEFHLEPIIQGVPWLFCAFCLFSGLIGSIDFDSRNAQNNVEEV